MKKLAVMVLCLLLLQPFLPVDNAVMAENASFQQTVHEPTCTEPGYTEILNTDTGVLTRKDEVSELGHDFGPWQEEAQEKTRVCARCGFTETIEITEPARVELTGSLDGIGKKEMVTLSVDFDGEGQSFSCYTWLSLQGHSTLQLDKPNFTMRLYDDTEGTEKHRVSFGNWHKEHKYILKACMNDPTICRNLVCARIWADMVRTREGVDSRLLQTPNLGAVDGFPTTVWLNGEFIGLYTMNLHKDNDLYDMAYGDKAAVVIANHQYCDESLFQEQAQFDKENFDWEIEYCGTEDDTWVRESFNRLIRFVMDSDDKTFKSQLNEYLDVNGALDYLLFIQSMGLLDNSAKDLILITYDGQHWIPTVYDMDDAFLDPCIPFYGEGEWCTGTESLLWDRLMNSFFDELAERYRSLRSGILSDYELMNRVSSYIDSIPSKYYEADLELFPDRETDGKEQILEFIPENMKELDGIYGGDIQ